MWKIIEFWRQIKMDDWWNNSSRTTKSSKKHFLNKSIIFVVFIFWVIEAKIGFGLRIFCRVVGGALRFAPHEAAKISWHKVIDVDAVWVSSLVGDIFYPRYFGTRVYHYTDMDFFHSFLPSLFSQTTTVPLHVLDASH